MSTPTNGVMLIDPYGHGSPAGIDPITASLATIDIDHGEIHAGRSWWVSDIKDLGNGEVFDILITAPTTASGKEAHLVYEYSTNDGEFNIALYKNVVTSTAGTAFTISNRRLNLSTQPSALCAYAPTVTSVGNLVGQKQYGQNKSGGGGDRALAEVIISDGIKIMLRFTNATTTSNMLNFRISWYEVDKFA
jgi:hypothetical protein